MTKESQNKFWELATAKLHNEADEQEINELDDLLKEKANEELYAEIEQLKTDTHALKIVKNVSQNQSWERVSSSMRKRTIQKIGQLLKYAAIVVFAFIIGALANNNWNNSPEQMGTAVVKVPLGQMSEITLPDGTEVWLNSGTTLSYNTDFGKSERNVSLSGEAFFDVTTNGTPFKVKFKQKEIEVLGTQFNVIAYDDEKYSTVTLVEGKVNVNSASGNTFAQLKPAEQIVMDEISNEGTISKVETNFYVSWIEGKIIFSEEKLYDVAQRLERWYNVEIKFEEPSLRNLTFSGTILKNKPFDQIITAFELLLPLKIKYTHVLGGKDIVIISKK